jgi:murein L,D-transpeptidase YcbB/YkuD
MSTWIKAGIAAALAAAIAGFFVHRAGQADRDAMEQRLAQLEQRLASQEQANPPAAKATFDDPSWTPAERAAATRAAQVAMEQPAKRPPPPTVAVMEQQYAAEKRDAVWAAGAELALAEAAASDEIVAGNLMPENIDARCRSKSCRIVATFADPADADDWAYAFMTHTAGTLRRIRKYDKRLPDGRVEVTFYGDR